jgi:DNA-binding HxlR family transcriptional regulator
VRTYHQYCGVARALDVVGDRWTLLIVRELLVGARRYSDLLDDLPGIATNLLADRLRDLTALGVVVRCRSGRSASYELTDRGRELESVVLALARWGGETMVERPPTDEFRPHWLVVGLRSLLDPSIDPPLSVAVDLEVEGGVVHVVAVRGAVSTGAGPATTAAADVVLAGEGQYVLGVAAGVLPFTALDVVRGSRRTITAARRLLVPDHPLVAAPR